MITPNHAIVIFDADAARVEVRVAGDSVWLSLQQLADLFGRDKSVISRHLKNVFDAGELERSATVAKNATVQKEGEREVMRDIEYFNLDVIISVGYRVNSARATRFRQWATGVLREYLTQGYALDRERFAKNAAELEAALLLVKKAAGNDALTSDQGRGLVDVIARYTQTFLWLQRFDEGLLTEPAGNPGGVLSGVEDARASIARLKADLMARGEATDLFGRERDEAFVAILGNLEQTVFGAPAYPTVEAKAAHLLYFVIKNHPFLDGNKRIGSFLFVDFLARNGRLIHAGQPVVNDVGLAALALLVAESDPKAREVMIRLIQTMLASPAARG
jgi:prophage maintenance system killer protein/prophage antirepressor-like protein